MLVADVTQPPADRPSSPDDRAIRRTWRALSGAFLLLGGLALVRLATPGDLLVDVLAAILLLLGFGAALANRNAVVGREAERRLEAETFARMLHGLARSVSPDAVVDAIVAELAIATEADHVVVVRRRPDQTALDAALVTTRAGVADTSAVLPISDLEDAGDGPSATAGGPIEVVGRGAPSRIAMRLAARVRNAFGLNRLLVAPMLQDGTVIGAIIVSRRSVSSWSGSSRRLLAGAATEAATALARTSAQRDAEARATTDPLTGLPNRRYFDELCALLGRRRRAQDAVGILMIDIDHFKRLNDTFGHAVGDDVLRAVASAIGGAVRDDDVPARWGGEEFAVLLRNPSPDVAGEVGERVRSAVRALDLRALGVEGVSVSVGVAVSTGEEHSIPDLVSAADAALYEAKRHGRDRVIAAT